VARSAALEPPRGLIVIRPGVALLPFAAGLVALVASACGGGADASTEVAIAVHFSRFVPETVEAGAGVPITFTLRNDDPIEHEWIIGSKDVQDRHRTGAEPYHDQIPSEVTIPAFSTRVTTLTFDKPGEYLYICHLPGHEAYGMVGRLSVVES
jgi:uncharacterized cupredoxin-like copper-binding protein